MCPKQLLASENIEFLIARAGANGTLTGAKQHSGDKS
jgi:hypothetical protein